MSHLNYNHLYYFWMVHKQGSVTKAAETLCLTPQTITGQIRTLEERLKGSLFKRVGRNLAPTELGELVFRYADKMFSLSYEMLDVLNYRKDESILFEVGIADALSKALASRVLMSVIPATSSMHLACYESTHESLMTRLREHKLDMILSDCAGESLKYPEILSKKLGECGIAFFSAQEFKSGFPECLEEGPLLIPSRRTSLGQQLYRWFDEKRLNVTILGEFDDAAMMKAFGYFRKGIFVAPSIYQQDILEHNIRLLGETMEIKEEYHVMFAERMIQHPAVQRLLETDFGELFAGRDLQVQQF
ncbi:MULTISPECIES: transcriptional activator NhaR [Shewanella]|jgi:LysR family transcriptional activator of nhaA|uniref:Transcriptional activator protein NhaR n=1 Tax=Shewanella chilikensis TaxID=558541 RepID=A0A6G7LQ10_9GAMM|nr:MULTISPECIES: transcriptional activator NhaR [Shewanella]MBZ4678480.1 transcriptional activator NhaR [Shewanella sp.]MCL1152430.1 transcriptional activator NhaR [Shewanella chilikensis]PYE59244.1 LysR family transcriptional regulator [Shewanella chilikensis]QIJ03877.1 transcriptional activator NhaR [Shewanella chilikensis]QWL03568.1 transcriptional activator NhaR [Shewanella indica]